MAKALRIAVTTLALVGLSSGAFAATTPAKPATPAGKPATGVVCQLAKTGNTVHVQAINKGTAAVPAGDTFAFTIVGPTKKTDETITFKKDLAPGKAVNITNAIKAASVVSCTPAA